MPSEVILAKLSDIEIRPLLDSQRVSFTYLPTGKVALLTVEECADLIARVSAQIEKQGGV